MKIKIAPAMPEDVDAILEMYAKIMEVRGEPLPEDAKKLLPAAFSMLMSSGTFMAFVAYTNRHNKRKVIGMGTLSVRPTASGLVAYGEDVFVEEQYRGTTTAARLIQAGEEAAKSAGLKQMFVQLRPELNAMFERMGYKLYNLVMVKDVK